MPAKLTESQRLKLIERVIRKGEPVSRVCQEAGISRVLFYRWLKRYKEEGTVAPKKPLRAPSRRVPEKYVKKIIAIVKRHPSWSTRKISEALGRDRKGRPLVGNHGVQNVFSRLNLNTTQKREEFARRAKGLTDEQALDLARGVVPKKKPVLVRAPELSAEQRLEAIKRVLVYNEPVAQVCIDFHISRPNFYKWLKRYQAAPEDEKFEALADKKPKVEKYYRQTPEKYEEAVLSVVASYPEFGVARIVQALPQIAGKSIVGYHGVQNILRRYGLSTYEKRLAYAQAQVTPIIRLISTLEELATRFIVLPAPTRAKIVRFAGVTLLAAFSTTVILGILGYFATITAAVPAASRIGLFFTTTALLVGSFFFAYSMKYYFTLALVLSFSRQPGEGGVGVGLTGEFKKNGSPARGWLARIFGLGNGPSPPAGESGLSEEVRAPGLEPSLEHIKLKRHPFVSIHLPFYNERKVADRILSACTSFDWPNYEVIICDDSTDETVEIVKEWEKHPRVRVLHRPTREGFKGGALAYALKAMSPKTEFVIILDADFVPYPDTIQQFLRYFKASGGWSEEKDYQAGEIVTMPYETFEKVKINPKLQGQLAAQEGRLLKASSIACVAGYQWHVLNKSENWITRGVRTEYAGSYVIERPGQEILGALKIIHGSVYMIRADVLKHFGWGTSITEDFELTLRIYEKGFKVAYTPYIQAPSECVSTIKRLIRQRMRWSEGHSFNIKKMFLKLIANPKLSLMEKLEVLYISPYYLQAFFFLVGTFSWLISETLFPARLPFWTSLWGWSLVLTNFFALPLMNAVGLFLEESEERDYIGILSFIILSYLVVPFQAYASVKGFIEDKEGPWFRTPKTGKITDIFTRGRFYRWISGILPGSRPAPAVAASLKAPILAPAYLQNSYMARRTANNQFNGFKIKPKRMRWVSKVSLAILLILSVSVLSLSQRVPVVFANEYNAHYLDPTASDASDPTGETLDPSSPDGGSCSTLLADKGALVYWYTQVLPTEDDNGGVLEGIWSFDMYWTNSVGTVSFNVSVAVCDDTGCTASKTVIAGPVSVSCDSGLCNGSDVSPLNLNFGNVAAQTFEASDPKRVVLIFDSAAGEAPPKDNNVTIQYNSTSANCPSVVNHPTLTVPEKLVFLVAAAPFIPMIVLWLRRRRRFALMKCRLALIGGRWETLMRPDRIRVMI